MSLNPLRPLTPTGPTISGAFPDAICVLRMSEAVLFWTISNERRIFGPSSVRASWAALKSATAVC
jgi:hypothetical protein